VAVVGIGWRLHAASLAGRRGHGPLEIDRTRNQRYEARIQWYVRLMTKRILAVASGGGHWLEIRRLYPAFEGLDVAFVSVHQNYAEHVPGHRFYRIRDVTRWDRWGIIVLTFQLLKVLLKERPEVVITTGSAPGLFTLAFAKLLFRSRTMWIDSIANCEQLSVSGSHAKRVADVWLTQWPQLKCENGPDYWGAVL
jgi:UDP-N-acetylglucosamine:LPS N-acetylglucosamine transferase